MLLLAASRSLSMALAGYVFRASCSVCSLSCKFQMHKSNATHLIFTISLCFASGCSRAYAGADVAAPPHRSTAWAKTYLSRSLSCSFSPCLCFCHCVHVYVCASVSYACYNGWLGTPVRFPPAAGPLSVRLLCITLCTIAHSAQLTAHTYTPATLVQKQSSQLAWLRCELSKNWFIACLLSW